MRRDHQSSLLVFSLYPEVQIFIVQTKTQSSVNGEGGAREEKNGGESTNPNESHVRLNATFNILKEWGT